MIEDCLKLTTVAGRSLADAQLDLFGAHRIATSVLLRGAEGFGRRNQLRGDRLVSAAVDIPERIAAVLDDLRSVQRTGLITLERARLLRGASGPVELPRATRLTISVGRRERVHRVPALVAVCALRHRRGVEGAIALLGVDGTSHGERHRARFLDRNADVPVMIVAVGSGERVAGVLPELGALLRRPLLTLERVRVCKRNGELVERPPVLPGVDAHGRAIRQKLTVLTREDTLHDGLPVHRAIVARLRRSGAPGATAVRGIWGFTGTDAPHGDRLLQLGRRVPVLTVAVDTPERIAAAFDVVDEMTGEHGVVTSEIVPALAVDGDGPLDLAQHPF